MTIIVKDIHPHRGNPNNQNTTGITILTRLDAQVKREALMVLSGVPLYGLYTDGAY